MRATTWSRSSSTTCGGHGGVGEPFGFFARWSSSAALAGLVSFTVADVHTTRDRDRAQRQLRVTQQHLATTTQDLNTTQQDLAAALRTLGTTQAALVARTGERDQALADLVKTRDALKGALGHIDLQTDQIGTLTQCLRGVEQALNSVSVGDRDQAVQSLASVAGSCQSAEVAVGSGQDGAAYPFDFPDPFVLRSGPSYFGYSTNSGSGNVQVIQSTNLTTWQDVGDALPHLGNWAVASSVWGPSVVARNGGFVLYYGALWTLAGQACISPATSPSPTGPFMDLATFPMICAPPGETAIDPSPFVAADGTLYLLWSTGGIGTSHLVAQQLAPDGLSTVGTPITLIHADQRWEQGVVEGPAMVQSGGRTYLFYSGASWNGPDYAEGYAVCDGPLGPCLEGNAPVLTKNDKVSGPGGGELFRGDGGNLWMAYHAWTNPADGYPNNRKLHLARVTFPGGQPLVTPADQ